MNAEIILEIVKIAGSCFLACIGIYIKFKIDMVRQQDAIEQLRKDLTDVSNKIPTDMFQEMAISVAVIKEKTLLLDKLPCLNMQKCNYVKVSHNE